MRMTPQSVAACARYLLVLGAALAVGSIAGCGSTESDPKNRSMAGDVGAGGSSGSGGTTGGGNAGGGDAGNGGADTGGSGGNGTGGTGEGGTGNAGAGNAGSAGTGGVVGGSGGMVTGGTGGGGPTGVVGTLGGECSPPGSLACAGNYQKLTLVCGGDGTWQVNLTCGTDQFCDSTPGVNVGTCQPVAEGCSDGPEATFCANDSTLASCAPDAVATQHETCAGACWDGECRDDVDRCPDTSQFEASAVCSTDCGGPDCSDLTDCALVSDVRTFPTVVRTPSAEQACMDASGQRRMLQILYYSDVPLVVTVEAPWGLGDCSSPLEPCLIVPPSGGVTGFGAVTVCTDDLGAGPRNVVLQEGEVCP